MRSKVPTMRARRVRGFRRAAARLRKRRGAQGPRKRPAGGEPPGRQARSSIAALVCDMTLGVMIVISALPPRASALANYPRLSDDHRLAVRHEIGARELSACDASDTRKPAAKSRPTRSGDANARAECRPTPRCRQRGPDRRNLNRRNRLRAAAAIEVPLASNRSSCRLRRTSSS